MGGWCDLAAIAQLTRLRLASQRGRPLCLRSVPRLFRGFPMSDQDQSKSTNSPHLVATNGGMALAMWIGISMTVIWIVVMLMGDKVAIH